MTTSDRSPKAAAKRPGVTRLLPAPTRVPAIWVRTGTLARPVGREWATREGSVPDTQVSKVTVTLVRNIVLEPPAGSGRPRG